MKLTIEHLNLSIKQRTLLEDISLKTMPKISNRYNKYLNMVNGNYPHRLAIVVTVLLDLVYSI